MGGLLLERPVFDSYNQKAVNEYNREKINFDNYQKEMDDFKQREIYDRIFREEERDHQFHAFFHHVDHFRTDFFLWVTASGLSAAKQSKAPARTDNNSDDEADVNGEGDESHRSAGLCKHQPIRAPVSAKKPTTRVVSRESAISD